MYLLGLVLLSLLTLSGTKYVPGVTDTDIEIPSYSHGRMGKVSASYSCPEVARI